MTGSDQECGVQNVMEACTRVLTRNITQYSGHKVNGADMDASVYQAEQAGAQASR